MHAGQNKFSLKNFFSKYQPISRTCMKQSVRIPMNQSSRINQQECVFLHRLCGWFQSSKSQSIFLLAASDRHNPVYIGHKLNVSYVHSIYVPCLQGEVCPINKRHNKK